MESSYWNNSDSDWTQSSFNKFGFENYQKQILLEKNKQKELYDKNLYNLLERRKNENEKLLKKYDMATNLDRSLRNDQRFLTIGRKKIITSNVFGSSVLSRIAHDVEKMRKFKNQNNDNNRINRSLESLEKLNEAYRILNQRCPRFVKNQKLYLDREFKRLDVQQHLLDNKNDESFQLPNISSDQITASINDVSMDNDSKNLNTENESLNEKTEHDLVHNNNEIITSTRNISPLPVQIEPLQNNNNQEKAMFKPKSQIITSSFKLPKI